VASKSSQPTRSAAQIESDLAAARSRLTSSIESLIDQVHPERVKQRTATRWHEFVAEKRAQVDAKLAGVKAKVDDAKSTVVDAHGQWRTDRLALVGGGLAGLITLVLLVKKLAAWLSARKVAAPPKQPVAAVRRRRK
jgi:hypothetical protein